jgi:hypothetical protein
MKRLVSIAVFALVAVWSVSMLSAADDPKYKIKDVMGWFKNDKLNDKFPKGEASKEEIEKLKEGFDSMLKIKPPKGDEKDWKEKVEALAKAVKDDDKDGFKKAVNCMNCHSAHRGK